LRKSLEYRQERTELLEKAKVITDRCVRERRDFTNEENREENQYLARLELLNVSIPAQEQEEERELRAVGGSLRRPGSAPIGLQLEVRDNWSPSLRGSTEYRNAFREYVRYGKEGLAPENASLLQKEARALGTTTGSSGGYLAPEGFQAEIERALLAYGGMRSVSRILTTTSGNDIPWPTVNDTSNEGSILSEGATANETDPAFGAVVLKAYEYSSDSVTVAIQLLEDSGVNVEAILAGLLGERLARVQNRHFTVGDDNNKPRGVVNGATLGKKGTTGQESAVIYQDLLDLVHSVDPAYRQGAVFMLNDTTLGAVMGLKDSYGRYYFEPDSTAAESKTILGYPYVINQHMASMAADADSILFGNFQKYVIREVNGVSVIRLDQPKAKSRQVEFIAFARADGRIIDAGTHPIKYYENT
jgi:HK97 family phage major capsid protein